MTIVFDREFDMGMLVVRHYPTKLFLKAADHTYVECGTGAQGWSCWGGKNERKFSKVSNWQHP